MTVDQKSPIAQPNKPAFHRAGLKISDAEDIPSGFKSKKIELPGIKEGTASPHIYGDRLTWHVCIKPEHDQPYEFWLIQGNGTTPHAGIVDAVIRERRLLAERTRRFEEMEKLLSTHNKSVEQLEKLRGEL